MDSDHSLRQALLIYLLLSWSQWLSHIIHPPMGYFFSYSQALNFPITSGE